MHGDFALSRRGLADLFAHVTGLVGDGAGGVDCAVWRQSGLALERHHKER